MAACLTALWAAGAGAGWGPDSFRRAYTPLHVAAREGDVARVTRLVAAARASGRHGAGHGAGRGVDCRDGTGASPLHYAALAGHAEVVRLLIEAGADPCAPDFSDWTPLHCAANSITGDASAAAAELLPHYRSPDVRDGDGVTPLQLAARRGDLALVRRLIAAGADVNARDKTGQMSLHDAAWRNQAAVAEVLVAAGADLNARDNSGLTPLGYAESCHGARVAAVLRRLGAHS